MKVNNRQRSSLKDFKIYFRPRSITFFKKNTFNLKIYLEKDVQVIGGVKEIIPPLSPNINYTFSEFNEPIHFRVLNDKMPTYHLSLYRVGLLGVEQIIDQSQLKFSKFIQAFLQEFLVIEQQLHEQLKQKQKEGLVFAKKWKELVYKFSKKEYTSGVKFNKIEAILQFLIEPVHMYDELVQQLQSKEQNKSQKGSSKGATYKKSKAIPDYLPMDKQNAYFKKQITDNQLNNFSPLIFKFKANKQQDHNQSNFNSQLQTNQQNTLSQDSRLQQSTIKANNQYFIRKAGQPDINIAEQEEFDEKNTENPDVHLQKVHLIREAKPTRKSDILQIHSFVKSNQQLHQKASLKQSIIAISILVASLFLIIILMHPLSKV